MHRRCTTLLSVRYAYEEGSKIGSTRGNWEKKIFEDQRLATGNQVESS
jgi:hypothetical protein